MKWAEIGDKVMNHIERGGDTHPLVDEQTAGFMSSELYTSLGGYSSKRKYVHHVNVSELMPGLYEGAQIYDGPEGEQNVISLIDITLGSDGRRLIRFMNSYSEVSWIKTIHTNGYSTGWAREVKEVVLWQGENNFKEAVTLDKPIAEGKNPKYSAIKIVYQYYGNITSSETYANPFTNEMTFRAINLANNSSSVSIAEIAMQLLGDNQIKISQFREVSIDNNGLKPANTLGTEWFSVKKVIGVL